MNISGSAIPALRRRVMNYMGQDPMTNFWDKNELHNSGDVPAWSLPEG
jgi:hypothetical protein